MKSPSTADETKRLHQSMQLALMVPVVMCVAIGLVFLISGADVVRGITLLGLGAVIGVVNYLIVRFVLRRIAQGSQDESSPSP